ncbi:MULTISPECIES: M20 family metallopeptidase [unclassified Paenibacillus]|uniref:M20 family metallopeptidase n=1 Tax=unclassified Paenibacillus TaxID=185978 RepID=UPI000955E2FF|nr:MULTISPECIES: M20 family metallopeptidase [unclassified Paenibacillus]ASS64734.1 M20 family metallopeptidase [Paenibacillus sp. RUD330]SIR08649.1 amidohydrolase [Paenibacillus sp. RU4X]SIR27631.1 amidohydrolase [Paenibacillus sp. RU4T]
MPVDHGIIQKTIQRHGERWKEISLRIAKNPELGHEEFLASSLLADELEQQGFSVERGTLGMKTAFVATYDSGKPGPVAAFLCEYDALPEIGHACGHHIIGVMGVAAASALKAAIGETGGSIRVFGTPAEETSGGKVPMSEAGLFDDCGFALMAHPYHSHERSGASLALDAVRFEYHGRTAHAAASPHLGINALDAVLMLFGSSNAMRQQTRSDGRIHGIIDHGGQAPNIIPGYASAKFYVRSGDRAYTDELTARLTACAEGAALQTGCKLEVSRFEFSYDELRTNEALSAVYTSNLIASGISEEEIISGSDHGSLDLGNVSLRCPAIHPYLKVVNGKLGLHTAEFRDAAMKEEALEAMLQGAGLLASTALDVLADPELYRRIREEFGRGK